MTMRWHPPYDFLAATSTFIDVWPKAWQDLAPASELIPLNADEANALGAQIGGFHNWFTPARAQPLVNIARRMDAAIARQGRSSFVRLTSRSPKDSAYADRHGLRVSTGPQALAMFIEGSRRCAADLRMAIETGHHLSIVVRKWINFKPFQEFRCFMLAREWVGASQGQHLCGTAFPFIEMNAHAIIDALHVAMERIIATSPVDSAAFDLVYTPCGESMPQRHSATLLDANPLMDVTDRALFASSQCFDRTLRFYRSAGDTALVPLPKVRHQVMDIDPAEQTGN